MNYIVGILIVLVCSTWVLAIISFPQKRDKKVKAYTYIIMTALLFLTLNGAISYVFK